MLLDPVNRDSAGSGAGVVDPLGRVALYTAMSVTVPAIAGWVIGSIGMRVAPDMGIVAYALVGSLAASLALIDSGVLQLSLPMRKAPVPHGWRFRGKTRSAGRYGAVLSLGFLTPIYGSGFYLIVPTLFLLGRPAFAAATYGGYGFARSLPLMGLSLLNPERHSSDSLARLGKYWPRALNFEVVLLFAVCSAAVWAGIQLL